MSKLFFKKVFIWSFVLIMALSYLSFVPETKAGVQVYCGPWIGPDMSITVTDIETGQDYPFSSTMLPDPEPDEGSAGVDFQSVLDGQVDIPTGHRVRIDAYMSINGLGLYDNETASIRYLPNGDGNMVYDSFNVLQPNPDGGNGTGEYHVTTGPITTGVGDGFFEMSIGVSGCAGQGDFPEPVYPNASNSGFAHVEIVPYEVPTPSTGDITVRSKNSDGSDFSGGSWILSGFNGYSEGGSGIAIPYVDLDMGTYTVASNPVNCKIASVNPSSQTLAENGDTKDFTITYSDDPACNPPPPPAPVCGNGVQEAGEQCDDGVNNGTWPATCSNSCTTNSAPAPTANIKANNSDGPVSVPFGTTANITWSSTDATSCSVTPGGGSGTSGGFTTGAITNSVTYTLSCNGPGGSDSDSVTLNPGNQPTSDIKCDSQGWNINCTVGYNEQVPVSWQSSGTTSCTVKKDGNSWATGTTGTKNDALIQDTTYTLDCEVQ